MWKGRLFASAIVWSICLSGAAMHLFAADPDTKVTYSKDVKPIFQMHCVSCHHYRSDWWGPDELAGQLDMSSREGLSKGGDHGSVIIPGRPEKSLLYTKIIGDGTHKPEMPFESPPLSSAQVDIIRTWIAQGAVFDDLSKQPYSLEVEDVPRPVDGQMMISCRVLNQGFLAVSILDPGTDRVLMRKFSTAKWSDRGFADQSPGAWISWSIRWDKDWPSTVRVRLDLIDFETEPIGTAFIVHNAKPGAMGQVDVLPDPVDRNKNKAAHFKYRLAYSADLEFRVTQGRNILLKKTHKDLPEGQRYYKWNLRKQDGSLIPAGSYAASLRFTSRTDGSLFAVAFFFGVKG